MIDRANAVDAPRTTEDAVLRTDGQEEQAMTTTTQHVESFTILLHSTSVTTALAALRQHLITDHGDAGVLDWESDFGPLTEAGIETFRGFADGHAEEHEDNDRCSWCGEPADDELGTLHTLLDTGELYHEGCLNTALDGRCGSCGADLMRNDPHGPDCEMDDDEPAGDSTDYDFPPTFVPDAAPPLEHTPEGWGSEDDEAGPYATR